jgi:hypothetical protein
VAQIDVSTKKCTVSDNGKIVTIASPTTNCFYLLFEANKYGWSTKTLFNNVNLNNAVQINIYSFGRGNPIFSPMHIDKVDRVTKVMYYPLNGLNIPLLSFDVLINLLRPV